ncbi:hypothetical protein [Erythrobacter sp. THAF29]|uniref:hypothetical protein n=1 Tax=Erythrobacter sp. THAF29 TaxID=2587851 RepID=UPI0012A8FE98|nr:hypothetical protein [Erythrobacter sp. THAF29]QFT77664.1 hypothetical protein FIU90_08955 [Erythrobacter sp. THAF29]
MINAIIIVSILLMTIFVVAAIYGGRAHDRQNAERERIRIAREKMEKSTHDNAKGD